MTGSRGPREFVQAGRLMSHGEPEVMGYSYLAAWDPPSPMGRVAGRKVLAMMM